MRVTWEEKDIKAGVRLSRWDWDPKTPHMIVELGHDSYVCASLATGRTLTAPLCATAMVTHLNSARMVPADFLLSDFAMGPQ